MKVRTGSRLHFGLFSLEAEGARWPDRLGWAVLPVRRFGGVGLMVESPAVAVRCEPAPAWSAEGPLAERALAFARRWAEGGAGPPQRLVVEQAPPEHAGLGTGTQLGLAVARALAAAWGEEHSVAELARRVGRGARSGLGTHGFAHGGLLVDGGKGEAHGPAPLLARLDFPEAWRLVVALPQAPAGLSGAREREAFAHLSGRPALAHTEALCRLVLLGLLPALAEGDLYGFALALEDLNARVGEAFAPEQGGPYAGPAVAESVKALHILGALGVGQSSWGPAVFALAEDEERAQWLAERLRRRLGLAVEAAWVTAGRNRGAEVSPA
jgi:beta-RFAP synthase